MTLRLQVWQRLAHIAETATRIALFGLFIGPIVATSASSGRPADATALWYVQQAAIGFFAALLFVMVFGAIGWFAWRQYDRAAAGKSDA